MPHFKEFAFKKIGYTNLLNCKSQLTNLQDDTSFLKIIFVKAGGNLVIDFQKYHLHQDAIFFINVGQHYWLDENCEGTLLYYNKDFYCVEIHDKEVACDGILFNNVYQVPVVYLITETSDLIQNILHQIKVEMEEDAMAMEEMLRTLLKQIIIKCTRVWKINNQLDANEVRTEVEFLRTFSRLVEQHFINYHTVAEYAKLLHITPKALNKRITRFSSTTPNDIIKNRIVLEAKRLLVHTQLSIQEISYQLGYEDASYFSRFFAKNVTLSPVSFRSQYLVR